MITTVLYNPRLKEAWDRFTVHAKNSHFFFQRTYMEYHSNKFKDFSLMFYGKKNKLIALLPANIQGAALYSHQGLTFGGLIVSDDMKATVMLQIFQSLKQFLRDHNIKTLFYKAIPYIYHIKAAEEDRYALFLNNAKLYRVDAIGTIYLQEKIKYSNGRRWSIKRAAQKKLLVEKSHAYHEFWHLLETVLLTQHKVKPVHSLQEMLFLSSHFPENIHLFTAKHNEQLLAAALVYENKYNVHLQYAANSNEGREIGALDFLVDYLIKKVYQHKKYFDFGNSNEENGKVLNEGLMDQKERFDARVTVQEFYELTIL